MINIENLDVFRGDTFEKILLFKDDNGNVIDITGAEITFTIKNDKKDEDVNSEIQQDAVITDAINGIATLTVTAATMTIKPKIYVYDIQFKSNTGTIRTLVIGDFNVLSDVTRKT